MRLRIDLRKAGDGGARFIATLNSSSSKSNMADRHCRRRRLQRYWNRPSKRVIRDRLNPLEAYTDDELFERYRFRQASVVYLLNSIGGTLLESTRNNALPPMLQLFVCLRFFATGAFHKLIGDSLNISESTVGRCWFRPRLTWCTPVYIGVNISLYIKCNYKNGVVYMV